MSNKERIYALFLYAMMGASTFVLMDVTALLLQLETCAIDAVRMPRLLVACIAAVALNSLLTSLLMLTYSGEESESERTGDADDPGATKLDDAMEGV